MNKENNSKQHDAFNPSPILEALYGLSSLEKEIFYMLLAQLREDDPDGKKYTIHPAEECHPRAGGGRNPLTINIL